MRRRPGFGKIPENPDVAVLRRSFTVYKKHRTSDGAVRERRTKIVNVAKGVKSIPDDLK